MTDRILPWRTAPTTPPAAQHGPVQTDSRLGYALRYAALGWHVMPLWQVTKDGCACGDAACKNPGKHPISYLVPRGQDNATTDEARLRYWFESEPEANIGIFLRPSGLMAIDIDPRNGGVETIEAIEAKNGRLESDVLAITGGGGEHRVFLAPANGTLPGKLGDGVDVKLNGYIVVEPSNHASGQRYQWEGSSDPLEGAVPSPLPDWLRDLVGARVAVDHQPVVGERFVTEQQVEELQSALACISADDYHQWINVGQALRSIGARGFGLWDAWSQSSGKYDAQAQGRKWRSFKPGAFNIESIFHMAQQAGWRNPLAAGALLAQAADDAPVVVIEDEAEEIEALPVADVPMEAPGVPPELLAPPGILGDIARHILATAQRPQPVLAVTAALSLAGTVLGRKVATETGLRSNLYLVGVAGTAAGKEHPRNVIKNTLAGANLGDFIGGEDIGSGQGLVSRVAVSPNVLFQIDEFGLFMQDVQNPKAGSHRASILTNFIKLFSSAGTVYHGTEYANQKDRPRQDIEYPCVHLHATTTPETLFDALGSQHVTSGYLNRMLVTFAGSERPRRRRARPAPTPAAVKEWIEAARSMSNGLAGLNPATPIIVGMDGAAAALFDAFDDELEARITEGEKKGTAPLWGRAWEHAAKVALVCACAQRIAAPVIDRAAAEWAIHFVRFHVEAIEREVSARMADSPFMKVMLAVARAIQKAGKMGMTERDLSRACSPFKALKPQERNQVLEALIRDEEAQMVKFKTASGKGRPRQAFVAVELLALLAIDGEGFSTAESQ